VFGFDEEDLLEGGSTHTTHFYPGGDNASMGSVVPVIPKRPVPKVDQKKKTSTRLLTPIHTHSQHYLQLDLHAKSQAMSQKSFKTLTFYILYFPLANPPFFHLYS
jgi:hypothetical protein